MKILGCGLGAPARGVDVSPEGIRRKRVTVAGRGPSIRSRVGLGAMSIAALALAACGGGGGGGSGDNPPPPPATQYTIGGTVTGLSGSGLVLQDNGGDDLAVSASGAFTFATKVNSGANYSVTVKTQPSGQTCTVANGSGTATANVTNVAVSCASASAGVKIGGTVTGLTGTGLVLQDNKGDNLTITQNGSFTFATAVATGAAYAVTVATQPSSPTQNCTVVNGTGTAASTDVTSVMVNCAGVGKFAYTASNSVGMIYAFTIDPNSGALAQAGGPYPDGSQPAAVSLAPNGKFAFSASDNGTKIHAFTIDQTSGQLKEVAGSPFSTGFATGSAYPDIAVDAASAHLYLASAGDGKVAGFSIDQTTGALTALPGSPYASGANASGIPAFSPDGKHLYVVDDNATGGVFGYTIAADGSLSPISTTPFPSGPNPYWISFTPDGKFAYVSNNGNNTLSAYSVNATTGALTANPTPVTVDGHPKDLTVDAAGTHLYVPVSNDPAAGAVDAFTINADGTLTAVAGGPWPVGIGPKYVTVDPTGRFAYVASAGTNGTGVYGFSINSTTGALTAITGSPFDVATAGTEPQFVTVDPSGKFAYTANQGKGTVSGFTIDQTTGALTAVSGSPYKVGAQPFFVSISPEAPGVRD